MVLSGSFPRQSWSRSHYPRQDTFSEFMDTFALLTHDQDLAPNNWRARHLGTVAAQSICDLVL